MKAVKFAKYIIHDIIVPVAIYYSIFMLILLLLAYVKYNSIGRVTFSGMEFATVFFLFVMGLNMFKENFNFSQANGLSRKSFLIGTVMGIIPIALGLSILDLIINRVYNLFVHCPTNFDMIYGIYKGLSHREAVESVMNWAQLNSISTLFGTIVWQFALYSTVIILGILISLIYFRSNSIIKIVVSVVPLSLIMLLSYLADIYPTFERSINQLITAAFGWNTSNPYIAVFSFLVIFVMFTGVAHLLVRRAVPKE
ncbi:MAG: hypothetical protein ACOZCL_17765 [Bacillota bacterium]